MPRSRTLPLLLLAAAAGPAAAQEAVPALFVERVDVDVVNVTAIVTDRNGEHVTGLGPEDFELRVDGKPVEISNFLAETAAERLARALERGEALQRGEPRRIVEQEQTLRLVVYVDNANITPGNRTRVLGEIGDFVATRIARGDEIMVVSNGLGLTVHQDFTRDAGLVEDAIRAADTGIGGRAREEQLRRMAIQHMFRASEEEPEVAQRSAYQYLRSYVQSSQQHLRHSMETLRVFVRSLGGLPGRKAILYVSDGLPKRPGEDLYQVMLDLFSTNSLQLPRDQIAAAGELQELIDPNIEMLQEDQSHLFNDAMREANAAQVTFYTLDARGPVGSSSLSAELPALAVGNGGATPIDQLRTQSLQEPLIDLAVTTGGAAVLNSFRVREMLDELAEDFDSYYLLGFRPATGGDGRYHDIEVRAKRPGLEVRHRAGYTDKPEVARVGDRTFASLLLGMGKNPLGVTVEFGEPEKTGRRRFQLPVLVRIPVREVTLLPQGGNLQGRLRIFLAVRAPDGALSDLHEFEYPLAIPEEQMAAAREQEVGFLRTLELGPGTPQIAIGVWDELSGADSYTAQRVRVGVEERASR